MNLIVAPWPGEILEHWADIYCPKCSKVTPHTIQFIYDEDEKPKWHKNTRAVKSVCYERYHRKEVSRSVWIPTIYGWSCLHEHTLWLTKEQWCILLAYKEPFEKDTKEGHLRRC